MQCSSWGLTLLAAFAISGCDCEGDVSVDGGLMDGGLPRVDGGGRRDGGGLAMCTEDTDCTGGRVCHPFSQVCVTPGATCGGQAECTDGTYCDATAGVCLSGTTGSPCADGNNCTSGTCVGGACGCDGITEEQMLVGGPLDVYLILDRTGSMGTDCNYVAGDDPPVNSKACFATYALSDYLINVEPTVDTRLAFQFMSQPDDCDGDPYLTPLVPLTPLPVTASHAIITEISDENFAGGLGTHIEGALRGLAGFTAANRTSGREMIGVLVTDGDPQGCEDDIDPLAEIIADHLTATGIRTFVIGMTGASFDNLEAMAVEGGAEAHTDFCGGGDTSCHYWDVGDGSGDAIASALSAIIAMAVPLPCEFDVVDLTPPPGETLDYGRVNVTLTEGAATTTIGQVPDEASCPGDRPAWYYDDPSTPTQIILCPNACTTVGAAGDGARVDVVVGCQDTVILI